MIIQYAIQRFIPIPGNSRKIVEPLLSRTNKRKSEA